MRWRMLALVLLCGCASSGPPRSLVDGAYPASRSDSVSLALEQRIRQLERSGTSTRVAVGIVSLAVAVAGWVGYASIEGDPGTKLGAPLLSLAGGGTAAFLVVISPASWHREERKPPEPWKPGRL